MSVAADLYGAAFDAGWAPEPLLTVDEWADRHRWLTRVSSAEPGPWRTDRVPYMREPMRELSVSSPIERVVLMKGAQVAGTECELCAIGYAIHHAPGPILMVLPTFDIAKRVSKQRLAHMIEASPALRERVRESRFRDSGNTLLAKEFPGGMLLMTGANAGAGLRSMPIRWLFLDELDEYPGDVEGQGDPLALAEERTATYANRKIGMFSTPTTRGESRIEREYLASDQRRYLIPCPGAHGLRDLVGVPRLHRREGRGPSPHQLR